VRIERIERTFEVQVRITQFPLHPETPPEGRTLEELFAGRGFDLEASQARLADLMKMEGLPYGKRTHTYNSRLAQELAKWAETKPGGSRIHDALFRAYFVDGVNLADVDRLVGIAAGLGLSEDEARDAVESRRYRDAVDRDWQRSAELGVTGVPTFVMNDRGVVGAQPYSVLERLVLEGGVRRRMSPSDDSR
jgi:predicted DsbA family dithiol-disulfide isomerase